MNIKEHIRTIADFPKPGILFYDIGSLLAHGPAWQDAIAQMTEVVRCAKPDLLVGIESRGFLAAAPIACALGIGVVMARKKGKLPGKCVEHSYDLEYGSATLEIQEGSFSPEQRVLIVDDLLATGGTAAATIDLARSMGANVIGATFVIELAFLSGRKKLDVPVTSLVSYDE